MKMSGYLVLYGVVAVAVMLIPDNFIAFMVGVVIGGMVAINAGEQLRKNRQGKGTA